jgi:hypothetical protein
MKLVSSAIVALCLGLWAAPTARAEIVISLEIQGTVGEIMQVLRTLKDAGLGGDPGSPDDGMKMEVHSSTTRDDIAQEAPAEAPDPAAPVALEPVPPSGPGFSALSAEPQEVAAGEVLHVRVRLADPAGVVDTVEATLTNGVVSFAFDLFDNASHGDATAGDGMWSVDALMPGGADTGAYTLSLLAYDSVGAPVTVTGEDGTATAISASAGLNVKP